MEVCKQNQNGFYKFKERCNKRHENKICRSRKECTDPECTKRQRDCRYFLQCGYCKFSDTCAYSHMAHKQKAETLEKEVAELKDDVENVKGMIGSMNRMIQSLKVEQETKHCKNKKEYERLKRRRRINRC